jgi:hypothetical protein
MENLMFDLKKLSHKAIPGALEKAMRYRLLNEPREAESICLDILESEPENQEAIILLILSITDQFVNEAPGSVTRARELLPRLHKEYDRAYYAGIINERSAKAALRRSSPHSRFIAYDNLRKAMRLYEQAEEIHPEKNEDAILRWNACARMIITNKLEEHTGHGEMEHFLE